MKRLSIVTLYTAAALLAACQKDTTIRSEVVEGPAPTAAFTAMTGSLAVTFNNTSANAESHYWRFGDGTSSTAASPVHTYVSSGKYQVTLTTRSAAGYAATVTQTVAAAAPATADFGIASSFGQNVVFSNASMAIDKVVWDFGDNSQSTELTPDHQFPAYGNYTVKLTVTGLLGDVVVKSKTITVADNNLLKGGGFEASDGQFWTAWATQNNNPPVFGFTGDKPAGGYGAALRFPSFTNSSGSTNQLIYQAVNVVAGKKYQLSARVKAPAGGSQCYFQFYISTDANTWVESTAANANHFLVINTWWGWGSQTNTTAIDGDLVTLANKTYGFGATTGGVYVAPATGTVYIGVQAGTWQGKSNGDWLLDNLSFTVLP
ncbi:PKD domain-containing protein [Paraflavitalea pollutisoli]|uniref:PKD domain-containing protein n=1 Tax=Paraflavitalea pollutisoli TaxID=3034143 RepID=UPI0023EC1758|nr:PKD domain-containing protein [Paraflavitalea sp. H1-2-19X]